MGLIYWTFGVLAVLGLVMVAIDWLIGGFTDDAED